MISTVDIANSNGYQVIIVFDDLWRIKCHYRAGGTGTAVVLPLFQFCIVSMENALPFVIHYIQLPYHLLYIIYSYRTICYTLYTVTVPFVIHYIQLPYHLLYIIYSYRTICYTLYTVTVPFHLVSAGVTAQIILPSSNNPGYNLS